MNTLPSDLAAAVLAAKAHGYFSVSPSGSLTLHATTRPAWLSDPTDVDHAPATDGHPAYTAERYKIDGASRFTLILTVPA